MVPVAQWERNLPANAGDPGDQGSISGLESSLEEEMATCSSENPMDRGAWWATVHQDSKSQT